MVATLAPMRAERSGYLVPRVSDPIEQMRADFWHGRNREIPPKLEELQVLALLQIASELRALRSELATANRS